VLELLVVVERMELGGVEIEAETSMRVMEKVSRVQETNGGGDG